MTTVFPGAKDDFANPVSSDMLANGNPKLLHSTQHADANDALEALETKVGVTDSDDPSSLDYKARHPRASTSVTSDALDANASDAVKTVPLGKGCIALKISTDYPAWVRIYASTDAQTADSGRAVDVDPVSGAGVLLEVLTAAGTLEIVLSPTATLFSTSGTVNLPMTITNKDSINRAITAIITTVPIEG